MARFNLRPVAVTLAASLFIASPSNAGESSKDLSAYGPAWAGFYAGAHAGVAFNDDTDFIGGLQAGYNWLSGDILYGAEADYSFLSRDVGTIRGRVGQLMGDKLFYATAGIAFADDNRGDSTGLVIGGGVEFDLNHRWRNVTAGVEGLYYNIGDESDSDAFVLRGKLNYHLGADTQPLK